MISFRNPGLIDPLCITTIGVSVKETENPIGYFGTGLKYAIAIILRRGGKVSIYRGLEALTFEKKSVSIRGVAFDVVTMNGRELGFTTALGKNWEPWQAFREVYCNMRDEGGFDDPFFGLLPEPRDGETLVCVSSPEFEDCLANIGEYFIRTPIAYKTPAITFHHGPGSRVFYRGIAVGQSKQKPFLFVPNIQSAVKLTEDRTLADPYEIEIDIARAVLTSQDAEFIRDWLLSPEEYAEHEADINWSGVEPGELFLKIATEILLDSGLKANTTLVNVLSRHKRRPALVAAILLPHEQAALDAAISFCKALGYSVDDYPISVVESLGDSVLGQADSRSRTVVLARTAITRGDATLAGTLIEEWVHLKHGYSDQSRGLQNWLLDNLVRLGKAYLDQGKRC